MDTVCTKAQDYEVAQSIPVNARLFTIAGM